MKGLISATVCSVALLTTCASPRAIDSSADEHTRISWSPLSSRDFSRLQYALRHCTKVEMENYHSCTTPSTSWCCELSQSQSLQPILQALAAVPEWYNLQYSGPAFDFFCSDTVRFLNSEGRVLYKIHTSNTPFFRGPNGEMEPLLSFLPFPREH